MSDKSLGMLEAFEKKVIAEEYTGEDIWVTMANAHDALAKIENDIKNLARRAEKENKGDHLPHRLLSAANLISKAQDRLV